jgi:glycosyltransferase involved in cell wall biosynthesis
VARKWNDILSDKCHLPTIVTGPKEAHQVSVIVTVLNEEGTILELLESLLVQSRPADEIVIVDAGSKDATTAIIREYAAKGLPIKLLIEPGVNISRGRNRAINESRGDILAVTDGGCRPENDWLKNLVRPMEEDPGIDVVAGAYIFYGTSLFERCVVATSWTPIDTWNEDEFLPASRSIAFRRSAWQRVGGYPEYLDFGEDTRFDLQLKRSGSKFKLARDAVVDYQVRSSARSVLKATYNYVKWDVVSGEFRRRGYFWVYMYLLFFGLLFSFTCLFGLLGLAFVIVLLALYFIRFGAALAIRLREPAAFYQGIKVGGAMRLGEFFGLIAGMAHRRPNEK